MKDLLGMMQQAKKMQSEVKKATKEMEKQNFEGRCEKTGVEVLLNGKGEVKSVSIPTLENLSTQNLEEAFKTAHNQAWEGRKRLKKEMMKATLGDLNLPF